MNVILNRFASAWPLCGCVHFHERGLRVFCISTRRCLAALALAAAIFVVIPLAASAAGSPSIANAPLVQPGVQQFGDTSCCKAGGDPRNYSGQDLSHREFWKLPLRSGDRVTLNWQSVAADGVRIALFTPATTDFNYDDRNKVIVVARGSIPNKGQVSFTATRTGHWPLSVGTHWQSETSGYDFTVSVKHVARLQLAPVTSVSRSGSVKLTVRAPDGSPISATALKLRLEGFWAKRWHPLATRSPKAGKASFPLRLAPALRGTTIKLRVRAAGPSYLPAKSQTLAVRVR